MVGLYVIQAFNISIKTLQSQVHRNKFSKQHVCDMEVTIQTGL